MNLFLKVYTVVKETEKFILLSRQEIGPLTEETSLKIFRPLYFGQNSLFLPQPAPYFLLKTLISSSFSDIY